MQSILSQIEYRADGQIVAATFGNGLSETRTYDQQGKLVHQDLKDEADLIIDERSYSYDPAGNITARTGTPGDQHYNYDTLDRLIGQDIAADSKNWQYDYGPSHNRQTRTDGNLLEELYSYQPDTNRLNEIDKLLDAPDPGTPTSRQFTYNQANRLAEYIEDGQAVASYTYNALGQRTRKELEDEATLFHYDTGIQLLAETDEAGNSTRDYLWLGIRPVAQIESTGLITYLHTDHLLTPRIGTSDVQNIGWQWEGEVFGDIDAQGPTEINLRFAGQYLDSESEQHYNSFRDYAAALGRYLQSDPIGLTGGPNLYSYVNVNPLVFIDPFGLDVRCAPGQKAVPFPGQESRFPAVFKCEPSRSVPTNPQCPFGQCAAFNETFNSQCGIVCEDGKLSVCVITATAGAGPFCFAAARAGFRNRSLNLNCGSELDKINKCFSQFCRIDDCCG